MITKDFSLYSGERQTAKRIEDIRRDHALRYELAVDVVSKSLLQPRGKCLDVFCGNGYGTYILASALRDFFCEGVDGSLEAIKMAKEFYSLDNNAFEQKVFPFDIPENHFDFVVCYESLEHVENDTELFNRIFRSLNNEGIAFISVPNQEIQPIEINPHEFHYRHYSFSEIESMIPEGNYIDRWYGQNVYEFTNDRHNTFKLLNVKDMSLKENIQGQFNIYVIRQK